MLKWRVIRFSIALLPLAVFSGLGLVCQSDSLPTIAQVEQSTVQSLNVNVVTEQIDNSTNTTVVPVDNVVTKTNDEEVATEDEAPAVDMEAQNRDAERVARITTIRNALESYKITNVAYPEELNTLLTSAYLTTIPKDIDESDFSYTPIGALPAQYYDLCYTLEVGVGAITSGYHCANPDGVANP